ETMIPAGVDGDTESAGAEDGQRLPERRDAGEGVPYITLEAFNTARQKHRSNVLVMGQAAGAPMLSRHPLADRFSTPPHFAGQLSPLMDYLRTTTGQATTVVVSRQAARLAELWSERNSAIAPQTSLDELPH